MKKLLVLVLSLSMLFALCACGDSGTLTDDEAEKMVEEITETSQQIEEQLEELTDETADAVESSDAAESVGVANPITEYETLEEINELTGGRLASPGVMGITDKVYMIINCGSYKIAQYDYKINGNPWSIRYSSEFSHDISGLYTGDGTAFGDEPTDDIEYYFSDDYMAARWFNVDGQYVLTLEDGSLYDEETFKALADESYNLTFPGMSAADLEVYYAGLAGEYQDQMSLRAMAEITAYADYIEIKIHWGSSASESTEWTMTAKRYEDGLISYDDCVKKNLVYDESGNCDETVEDFPASGWFTETDGVLYWSGSGDEQTEGMYFQKYVE